jgi:ABC-2 type transport system ATP-binding protein
VSVSLAAGRTGGPRHGRHRAGPLELAGLRRRYGRTVALDGLSFTVEPGRIVGFLGPNGAGKTTAMRIVMGIELPDEGAVRWGGRPLTHADRLAFGYMPEQRGLYPKMRVRDHLAYLARLHGLTAGQAAAAGDRWLRRLELGAQAYARVEALSHGNQQRVQLAAALVCDPQVLVLDEPFSGLDPLGIEEVTGVLRELAHAGVTVVFSSHQLDLVEDICEQVAIIDRGRVVLAGAVRALKQRGSATLVVEVEGAGSDWYAGLPAAAVEHADLGRARVTFHDADPQVVLDRARAAGTIWRFAVEEPSLAELFLQAVGP